MACFLVPMGEALLTTALSKFLGKENSTRWRLNWLNNMLWGGVSLLAIEHIWHGEVTYYPPFLTALSSSEEIEVMLRELLTTGVPMAILVTVVWFVMAVIDNLIQKKEKTVVEKN